MSFQLDPVLTPAATWLSMANDRKNTNKIVLLDKLGIAKIIGKERMVKKWLTFLF